MARLHRAALLDELWTWARENLPLPYAVAAAARAAAGEPAGGDGSRRHTLLEAAAEAGAARSGRPGGKCLQAVRIKTSADEQVWTTSRCGRLVGMHG